ncbi:hypothetical protein V6V47_04500 [Micromonospora sp. CPCC 205539]|uniref:hypothetical protein n=1 Tax=Micromonospora sp. CPCC 205539 TaxID=3122408 RepID=UPI002FF29521
MFRYYISFSYQTATGFGISSFDVSRPTPIMSVADLAPTTAHLTSEGYGNVVILGFSRYAQPKRTTSNS